MKNMKRILTGLLLSAVLCTAACGTEEKEQGNSSAAEDSMKDDGIVGDTGEAIKDGAEDLGEDIRDGASRAEDSIENNADKAMEDKSDR